MNIISRFRNEKMKKPKFWNDKEKQKKIYAIGRLIMISSDIEYSSADIHEQARMYVEGIRDHRISDATLKAIKLAKEISEL
jgi:transposase